MLEAGHTVQREARLPDITLGDALRGWLQGPRGVLPARVARAIEVQRQNGEVLVGWVQAALLAIFTALYLAAPSTAPPDAVLKPVPWALGIYGCFTALRLYLAYAGRLSLAYRIISVFADVLFLMGTIWSFHIQYAQPAAFYLKAPTLLYVFIFIALRALSVSPAYVLFAGITAAAGWLLLLGYALSAPGGMALVTRDYIEYINSAKILIGGELDKVISILLAAGVLSVAAARSRELLHHAVADQAAAAQLSRFFSPDIAARLLRADELLHSGEAEQGEAAAMFIDLRGFTKLAASIPPDALIAMLREYQHIVVQTVHAHRGSIITFLGDGVMVTFGATTQSRTYCADALRCAEALLDALTSWSEARRVQGKPAPGVGLGVDFGTVTCGVIGEEGRLEFAVIGDPVNRAAKLQNQTKVEQVHALATLACRERAIAQGYDARRCARVLAAREVAGIAGTVDLVALDHLPPAPHSADDVVTS